VPRLSRVNQPRGVNACRTTPAPSSPEGAGATGPNVTIPDTATFNRAIPPDRAHRPPDSGRLRRIGASRRVSAGFRVECVLLPSPTSVCSPGAEAGVLR